MEVFDLDEWCLQEHDVVSLHEKVLPFALFAFYARIVHLLVVDALYVCVRKTLQGKQDFDGESLLFGMEAPWVGLKNDAKGAEADELYVFKVFSQELGGLRIVLQSLHHICILHINSLFNYL